MEVNDNNQNNMTYNVITEYLEKKCVNNDELKEQLNELIDIAQKNYEELDIYLKECKKVIFPQSIKFGYELLEKNQLIIQQISSIFDPNELDIFKQFEYYKNIIDPMFDEMKKLKKIENEELKQELENIKENKKQIKEKMSTTKNRIYELECFGKNINKNKKEHQIPQQNNFTYYNNCNLIQNNENLLNKINNESNFNENNINMGEPIKSEIDNENIEIKYLKDEGKYLFDQLNSIRKNEVATFTKLMKSHNQIKKLKKENPINKLEKYDKLLVMYFNKICKLNDFIKRASTKMYSKMEKRPKFK